MCDKSGEAFIIKFALKSPLSWRFAEEKNGWTGV